MVIGFLALVSGSTVVKALSINPGGLKWTTFGQLGSHFANNAHLYLLQLLAWLIIFGVSTKIMGVKASRFIPAFIILYIMSTIMFAVGGWVNAQKYNLEPPLVALIVGLLIANVVRLPKWLDSGFRVEYYVKTGIVLLGRHLPHRPRGFRRACCPAPGHGDLSAHLPGDILRRDQGIRPR